MKDDEGQGGTGKSAEGRVIVSEMMVERGVSGGVGIPAETSSDWGDLASSRNTVNCGWNQVYEADKSQTV